MFYRCVNAALFIIISLRASQGFSVSPRIWFPWSHPEDWQMGACIRNLTDWRLSFTCSLSAALLVISLSCQPAFQVPKMYIQEEPRQEPCPPGASILVKKIDNKYDTTQCKMISCLLTYVYFFFLFFNSILTGPTLQLQASWHVAPCLAMPGCHRL